MPPISMPFDYTIQSRPIPRSQRFAERDLYARFGQRILDLCICVAALPFLFPLMIVIACLVRLDGASAIYIQDRVGRGGKRFKFFKFRSMKPDADAILHVLCQTNPILAREWANYQKLDRDPRVTRVGRFLRTTSLDELPQLINVLRGEMSIVGPRPFTPAQENDYIKAGGRAYFGLRPGLTGLWQITERNQSHFAKRVTYDEAYARKLSLVTDLWIILRTPAALLTGK